jgi:hypothetical protein
LSVYAGKWGFQSIAAGFRGLVLVKYEEGDTRQGHGQRGRWRGLFVDNTFSSG